MNARIDYFEGRQSTGFILRSEVMAYDADDYYKDSSQRSKQNLRPQQNRTQHIDDGGQEVVTTRSDWDKTVGRWRSEVVSGFGLPAPRTTTTLWTRGTATIYQPV